MNVILIVILAIVSFGFVVGFLRSLHSSDEFQKISARLKDIDDNVKQVEVDMRELVVSLEKSRTVLEDIRGFYQTIKCPVCSGKGFVDNSDINRLAMNNTWQQGFCSYCFGTGTVERGFPLRRNPLSTDRIGSGCLSIRSPLDGKFVQSPAPDKIPFVKVGDEVWPGKVVCIIEAKKLYNEIESEVHGTVTEIFVADGSEIVFDQPLFNIKLSASPYFPTYI